MLPSDCICPPPSSAPRSPALRRPHPSTAGGYCGPSCTCLSCSNTPTDFEAVQAAREVVLAKNPRAFEVKVRLGCCWEGGKPAPAGVNC